MNANNWKIVLVLLLMSTTTIVGRRRGGGSGFGRGGGYSSSWVSSAARSSSSIGRGWFGFDYSSGKIGASSTGRNFGFTSTGVGSRTRSDMFKNTVVRAAAGYLTYQAGKRIIRHMKKPMKWNGRNYYWSSLNIPVGISSEQNICRMPIEPSDPEFGNVYTPEGSRPQEIVWNCENDKLCCGFECCVKEYLDIGIEHSRIRTIILVLVIASCVVLILLKYYHVKDKKAAKAKKEYHQVIPNLAKSSSPYPTYPPENGYRYLHLPA